MVQSPTPFQITTPIQGMFEDVFFPFAKVFDMLINSLGGVVDFHSSKILHQKIPTSEPTKPPPSSWTLRGDEILPGSCPRSWRMPWQWSVRAGARPTLVTPPKTTRKSPTVGTRKNHDFQKSGICWIFEGPPPIFFRWEDLKVDLGEWDFFAKKIKRVENHV